MPLRNQVGSQEEALAQDTQCGIQWEMLGRVRKHRKREFQVSKSSGGAVTERCQSSEGRKGPQVL